MVTRDDGNVEMKGEFLVEPLRILKWRETTM